MSQSHLVTSEDLTRYFDQYGHQIAEPKKIDVSLDDINNADIDHIYLMRATYVLAVDQFELKNYKQCINLCKYWLKLYNDIIPDYVNAENIYLKKPTSSPGDESDDDDGYYLWITKYLSIVEIDKVMRLYREARYRDTFYDYELDQILTKISTHVNHWHTEGYRNNQANTSNETASLYAKFKERQAKCIENYTKLGMHTRLTLVKQY